ncbi:MAG: DNA-processing protein DprA [candidate division Zixibacteria bacterium]|nr:DNA-processing protein DprA [candidate division Zixibacteria bacterium]
MNDKTEKNERSISSRVLALTYFCNVSPRLFEALLRHFKTLDAIYTAESDEFLQIEGINEDQAEELSCASDHLDAAEVKVQLLSERDIGIVTRFDDTYCRLLFELNDPPSLLFYRGRMIANNQKSVAVVGTRTASSEGIELTSQLVKKFASNKVQVVSSLVGGIDVTAHLTAKSAGGNSFGVLNCGFDNIDRAEGVPVAIDIVQSGGMISEYAPGMEAEENADSEVNRLIVGMAQAVVVVEAYKDSSRVLDLLQACSDVGKIVFFMIDPEHGALADKTSLAETVNCGAIPIEGFDRIGDIIKSLV